MLDQKHLTEQLITLDAEVSTARDGEGQRRRQRRRLRTDPEIRRLIAGDESQALSFLDQQPLKNLIMIGLIRDHGLESPSNRGNFYGCFLQDQLIGMALMGHCVLLSGSRETINHFAHLAYLPDVSEVRMMLGEEGMIESFHRYLSQLSNRLTVERTAPQVMLVLRDVQATNQCLEELRRACAGELDQVARMNAEGYFELNGVDPATKDPAGFRERVLKRIEMGRVWVINDEDGVAFKVDIVSMTDEAVYLEGILTRSDLRGTGLGSAALSALCRLLLKQHKAVCLFANADNQPLLSFYNRIGFVPFASYRLVRFAP
ncbi:MAG TPA: GNAT family N-acetyltransferase [Pyrinomonadaceae bacterium]|jgi:GNAT superfamily N-acetyltransferase|nr:GNAT family N-acetyltransferase [Pyrinomonadaceae bacterium]